MTSYPPRDPNRPFGPQALDNIRTTMLDAADPRAAAAVGDLADRLETALAEAKLSTDRETLHAVTYGLTLAAMALGLHRPGPPIILTDLATGAVGNLFGALAILDTRHEADPELG